MDRNSCRICLEEEGELETVCDCKGTQRFVHLNCIQAWIHTKYKPWHNVAGPRCELCKQRFRHNKLVVPRVELKWLVAGVITVIFLSTCIAIWLSGATIAYAMVSVIHDDYVIYAPPNQIDISPRDYIANLTCPIESCTIPFNDPTICQQFTGLVRRAYADVNHYQTISMDIRPWLEPLVYFSLAYAVLFFMFFFRKYSRSGVVVLSFILCISTLGLLGSTERTFSEMTTNVLRNIDSKSLAMNKCETYGTTSMIQFPSQDSYRMFSESLNALWTVIYTVSRNQTYLKLYICSELLALGLSALVSVHLFARFMNNSVMAVS